MPQKRERGQVLRHCSPVPAALAQAGQALAEFALMITVLILLLFGMTFAAFYAFRSATVDWGVFVTGVATGSYKHLLPGRYKSLYCDRTLRSASAHLRTARARCVRGQRWKIHEIGSSASAWWKRKEPPPPFACGASIQARRQREASNGENATQ